MPIGYFRLFMVTVATSNSTVEAPASGSVSRSRLYASCHHNWTGPNGIPVPWDALSLHRLLQILAFTVTATVDNSYRALIPSILITKPNVAASNSGPYCTEKQAAVCRHGRRCKLWSGPNGFPTQQFPQISNGSWVNGGTYRLITLLDGCSSDTTTTKVVVHPVLFTPRYNILPVRLRWLADRRGHFV